MEPSGIPALEKTVLIHVRRTGQARIVDLEAQLALHNLAVRAIPLANCPCRYKLS